jgi:hypothetical protein
MLYLKQSTVATVQLGPFVDEDDGKTAEAGLTISQADVRLSKNGAAFAQATDANAAAHDENGWYRKQLDATDTGTLGSLVVAVHESGALAVWHEFMVVPANVYDSLVAGSDYLEVDAVLIEASDATNQIRNTVIADGDNTKINAALLNTLSGHDPGENLVGTSEIGAAGAALSAVPYNAAWDAQIQSEVADALTAFWTSPATLVDLLWDDLQSEHVGAGTMGLIASEIATALSNTTAILADTGTDGVALSTAQKQAIADEILKRAVSNVEDSADDDSLAAVILASFHSAMAGVLWTTRKTDDLTTFKVRDVATAAGTDPVTSVSG